MYILFVNESWNRTIILMVSCGYITCILRADVCRLKIKLTYNKLWLLFSLFVGEHFIILFVYRIKLRLFLSPCKYISNSQLLLLFHSSATYQIAAVKLTSEWGVCQFRLLRNKNKLIMDGRGKTWPIGLINRSADGTLCTRRCTIWWGRMLNENNYYAWCRLPTQLTVEACDFTSC